MSKAEMNLRKMIEDAEADMQGRHRASNPVGYDQRNQYLNDLREDLRLITRR